MARFAASGPALLTLSTLLCACTGGGGTTTPPAPPPPPSATVVRGVAWPGGEPAVVAMDRGRVVATVPDGADVVDLEGAFVVPAFVDSHVHLEYYPVSAALASAGVAAAVDLAAPVDTIGLDRGPLRVLHAGPMLTAPMGYPTLSWGRAGYGAPCSDADECAATVRRLDEAGAGVIKVAVSGERGLSAAQLGAVVEQAHALELRVAAHALTDEDARRAGDAGVDLLAHTPAERLSAATVALFADRAVISTLRAFGASPSALDNLARLREVGATVLYGTDLGNTRDPSIDASEIAALQAAGLSAADIIAAGTATPAAYWSLEGLGALEPGSAASFLVLDRDPLEDPSALSEPVRVYVDGVRLR